jgi:phosphoribosylanthranilate isomerase
LRKCFTDKLVFLKSALEFKRKSSQSYFFFFIKPMPLKMFVKVGSITNLSDARYCAGMGVDLLGFNVIEGQENYVSPKQFQEIRGWISGPGVVAQLYGIHSADMIAGILESYRPDYLELGTAELGRINADLPLPYILSLDGSNPLETSPRQQPAYIQVQAGRTADAGSIPVLLSVVTADEVKQALHESGVQGISLNGGKEIRPGLKAQDELNDILELLDTD